MRYFNTAGPVRPDKHYNVDPLTRIDLPEILSLIEQEKYFVLHAPRQTGKTSALFALRDKLNREGRYHCVYMNVEDAQAARENFEKANEIICNILNNVMSLWHANLLPVYSNVLASAKNVPSGNLFGTILSRFCSAMDKPLILLVDEIDSLVGDSLISILRQFRSFYPARPDGFPQSIVLCGVRDVRDYRIHSDLQKAIITGGSAFNIKSESLRLEDFTMDEIRTLFLQHTAETGQIFEQPVFDLVWELTEGQPWLVNALAYEACFKFQKERSKPITCDLIEQAKENMILRRDTHIDILIDKLSEDRVQRVIEPMIFNEEETENLNQGDVSYVMDMGLIKKKGGRVTISNGIYREIIPRELTYTTQITMNQELAWYLDPDGDANKTPRLRMDKLLTEFQRFFRDNSEVWLDRFAYREAGPHLLLMAFLQRVLNGGGRIDREYGLGMKRIDLLVEYAGERFAIELKLWRSEKTIADGLKQLREYMDKSGAKEGHLVIFQRGSKGMKASHEDGTPLTWEERIFVEKARDEGKADEVCPVPVTMWGM